MKHMSLFALTVFTLATNVHAQTLSLSSGDIVTVSGTGTVGTMGGKPIANTTKSYSSAFSSWTVETDGTAAFTLDTGGSISADHTNVGLNVCGSGPVIINGGSISSGSDDYGLWTTGSGPVIVSSGSITVADNGYGLYAINLEQYYAERDGPLTASGGPMAVSGSPMTITGGSISAGNRGYGLYAQNSGSIAVSGGTISAGNKGCGLYAIHSGPITITGGSIKSGSEGYGMYAVLRRGSIIITGGSIKAGNNGIGLITYGTSPFTITGGSISIGSARKGLVDYGALVAYGGPVTIRGGSISAGAGGFGLVAEPGGSIDLYGKFDGLTLGETKNLSRGKGSFTGTLQNEAVPQTFTYRNKATIRLHDVALVHHSRRRPGRSCRWRWGVCAARRVGPGAG